MINFDYLLFFINFSINIYIISMIYRLGKFIEKER